jgi:uncharacterized protein (TIGR03437 family)
MGALSAVVLLAGGIARGQSVTVTAAPGSINLYYLEGATTLPAAQNANVTSSAPGATYTATIAPTGSTLSALWLTATPDSGTLPAKVSLRVNPTGLEVGTYTASVTFTPAAALPPGTAGVTNVKLVVTEPPPTLAASPSSLTFSGPPSPAAQMVQLTTSAGPISFTASAGTATWLSVSPASGVVLPGGPVTLTVSVNPIILGAQVTPYTGKIVLTETGSASKTQTIPITFTNSYQAPTMTALWPPTGKAGSPATTITIFGANFGVASIAQVQGPPVVALTTTFISSKILYAVIPAEQMATGTTLIIQVTNPAPAGTSVTTQNFTFTPTVDEAVNSASYLAGGAPGELITLFGDNIGPSVAASMTSAGGYVTQTLGGVSVLVDGNPAPMVYVSQHQINIQIPYEASIGPNKAIVVSNGASPSANGTIKIAATSPGIFTSDGTDVAAINTGKTTGTTSINSSSNAAHIGDSVSLYVTGEGTYTTAVTPLDGYIIPGATAPAAMPVLNAAVTATIDAVNAPVTYAGPFDGGMLGVLEVTLTVPSHTTSIKGVPVVVTIGGNTTQASAMIATQP